MKKHPNERLDLENDVGMFFFTEFFDKSSTKPGGNFQEILSKYTASSVSKIDGFGSNWTSDHELMLSTILQERFTMGSIVNEANV